MIFTNANVKETRVSIEKSI